MSLRQVFMRSSWPARRSGVLMACSVLVALPMAVLPTAVVSAAPVQTAATPATLTASGSTGSGDIVVIGDQTSLYSGGVSTATGNRRYEPGPVAGLPTTTVEPVGHTVTLAVNDSGRAASITLAWPMRPGVWQLGLDPADPEQHASLTREANECTFTSGVLDVHLAEAAPDGGVAVLSADINGSCATPGGPYLGAAVRIGDTDPTRALSVPRAQPESISTGAVAGTIVRHQVTVTNVGSKPWKVDAVGTGSTTGWSPLFQVEAGSDTCTGVTLAPAEQCSVSVIATSPTYFVYEHLVVTGDAAAMLVVPLRLEGFPAVAQPTGASTLPGRLASTVTWDVPSSQPTVGYRVYDTTGGQRTLVASAGKAETSMIVAGSGVRRLALVAANGMFAESPDVVLSVPAVTSEVVTNDWYGVSTAFATDVPGAQPRPTRVERVDLDPSRHLWVTARLSNVSVCRVDTEVCTPVAGTATSSAATDPQEAVWLPDGTIAFIRGATPDIRTLWVVNQDGSGLRQVASVPQGTQLAAAPSGSEVLVLNPVVPGSIERVRLLDGHLTTVPGTSGVYGFSVSSRGLLVLDRPAATSQSTPPQWTTVVMNLDGSGAHALPLPVGDNRNVTFDPTGTMVAYSVFSDSISSSVWVAKADGSSPRPVSGSVSGYVVGLKWSVDNAATPSASLDGPTYSQRDVTLLVGAADADDPVGSLRRECRLDAVTAWSSCPATLLLKGLAAGRHTAYARVTDPNGHQSAIATRTWTVDSSAPFTPLPTARVFDGTVTTTPRLVQIAGLGGVPADATAVMVNTEVSGPSAAGYVRVTPAGLDAAVATQEFAKGQTISNLVAVKLVGGKIQVKVSAGSARILMDVSGYYSTTAGASYTPLPMARVFDGTATTAPRLVQIAGLGGVPADATAVMVNTEVSGPTAAGYVRVTPAGQNPGVATQEFVKGQLISNLVAVKLVGGKIQVKVSAGSARILMDVSGYFGSASSGAYYTPLPTARVFDGTATTAPRLVQIAGLGGVPADATAVMVNTEVSGPTAAGYVRVTPAGQNPGVATQEFAKGQLISNLVAVKLVGGKIQVKVSAGSARILMDVAGYYGA
jgi:hypothetical protein